MSNRVGIVVRLVEAGFCAGVAVQAATSGKPQHKARSGVMRRSGGASSNDLSPAGRLER